MGRGHQPLGGPHLLLEEEAILAVVVGDAAIHVARLKARKLDSGVRWRVLPTLHLQAVRGRVRVAFWCLGENAPQVCAPVVLSVVKSIHIYSHLKLMLVGLTSLKFFLTPLLSKNTYRAIRGTMKHF